MRAWVIKRDDGLYFNYRGNNFTKNIYNATMYECEMYAVYDITNLSLKNCRPVQFKIKEVEDEQMKDKYTIFGKENFIDKTMVNIISYREEQLSNAIYESAIKYGIVLDKEKFKKWLNLCAKLEQIDETDLTDFATKKKFAEKDQRITELEKALELLRNKNNYYLFVDERFDTINVDYALIMAKEALKNE